MNELHSEEDEGTQYLHIPTNRPVVSLNDAFAHLVRASINRFEIIQLKLDLPGGCKASCMLREISVAVGDQEHYDKFEGHAESVNGALREMLDQVNDKFSLGGEYEDPSDIGR